MGFEVTEFNYGDNIYIQSSGITTEWGWDKVFVFLLLLLFSTSKTYKLNGFHPKYSLVFFLDLFKWYLTKIIKESCLATRIR